MHRSSWLRGTVLSLALLAAGVGIADAAPGARARNESKVTGAIVAVHQRPGGPETIVVRTGAPGSRSQVTRFTVNSGTRVMSGNRGSHRPGNLSDLHRGERVTVFSHGGVADMVRIRQS